MKTMAAIEKPTSRPYSKMAQPHENRADSLIPRAATTRTRMSNPLPTAATAYTLLAAELLKKVSM